MGNKEGTSLVLLTNPEFVQWVLHPNKELDIYWENWMRVHPESIHEVKEAREILLGLKHKPLHVSQEVKSRVLQNILANDKPVSSELSRYSFDYKESRSWLTIKQWYKVAVILVLTCYTGYLLNHFIGSESPSEENQEIQATLITKLTHNGEKLNFKLPDGSSVWLNSGSQLTFPKEFDSLERKVVLIGEGYFEVKKDTLKAFKVVSGNLETEALGTSFNVNFFNPTQVLVSLLSGKVKIQTKALEENFILEPGQQLRYIPTEKEIKIFKVTSEAAIGWKEGLLTFKNAGFNEVIESLERWYGVKIQVSGKPSKAWKLSGRYENQNLDLVLDRMSFVENFNYEINRKIIHLKF
ncbi:FecR domain-containing protein [uncultured Cyclobacterium sp.]|uniref:FecR family protein n=1 Tax=uncultured Cyclobacterium sp. TaxID=453820 RepID=UPI0030EDEF55|tara:strand:+ start:94765 stop:95823 length:1059 start_codon:yes stop_codon:yes gene_type:complete